MHKTFGEDTLPEISGEHRIRFQNNHNKLDKWPEINKIKFNTRAVFRKENQETENVSQVNIKTVRNLKILRDHKMENQQQTGDPEIVDVRFY